MTLKVALSQHRRTTSRLSTKPASASNPRKTSNQAGTCNCPAPSLLAPTAASSLAAPAGSKPMNAQYRSLEQDEALAVGKEAGQD